MKGSCSGLEAEVLLWFVAVAMTGSGSCTIKTEESIPPI